MADKLNIIIPELDITEQTKDNLMSALVEKGKVIDNNVPLSAYADYISSIKPGVGIAQANQVLNGVTFTNQTGTPMTGTIPIIESQRFKIKNTEQTIPANSYIKGAQVFETDPNIKPENIIYGKSIAGVQGTLMTNAGIKRKTFTLSSFSGTLSFDKPIFVLAVLIKNINITDDNRSSVSGNIYNTRIRVGDIFAIDISTRGLYDSREGYVNAGSDCDIILPFVINGQQWVSNIQTHAFEPASLDADLECSIQVRTRQVSTSSSFSYSISNANDLEMTGNVVMDIMYKEVE